MYGCFRWENVLKWESQRSSTHADVLAKVKGSDSSELSCLGYDSDGWKRLFLTMSRRLTFHRHSLSPALRASRVDRSLRGRVERRDRRAPFEFVLECSVAPMAPASQSTKNHRYGSPSNLKLYHFVILNYISIHQKKIILERTVNEGMKPYATENIFNRAETAVSIRTLNNNTFESNLAFQLPIVTKQNKGTVKDSFDDCNRKLTTKLWCCEYWQARNGAAALPFERFGKGLEHSSKM